MEKLLITLLSLTVLTGCESPAFYSQATDTSIPIAETIDWESLIFTLSQHINSTNSNFNVEQDEFSSHQRRVLEIYTENTSAAKLYVSQVGKDPISVQIATSNVIFPDSLDNRNQMDVSVTFKFDNAEREHKSVWKMPMMKYNNAYFRGDVSNFVSEALISNQLSLKFDARGDIYRFQLTQ